MRLDCRRGVRLILLHRFDMLAREKTANFRLNFDRRSRISAVAAD